MRAVEPPGRSGASGLSATESHRRARHIRIGRCTPPSPVGLYLVKERLVTVPARPKQGENEGEPRCVSDPLERGRNSTGTGGIASLECSAGMGARGPAPLPISGQSCTAIHGGKRGFWMSAAAPG
ncbi:hypothetical protein NDU88_003008 [Pleurodeles waltl]|uniref:Uncharacterized protein n=1 Tax=Pleurodeles waltl TaxID=8319 RepID=A0AAV7L2V1_PLEWA|nr:hypothetical protein NDU88_003008 [Pleurodeles waltl]